MGSPRLKFVSYFGTFVSLSIITNPVNVLFSLGTLFFRSEIKTLYIYKEIKAAKQQKISKKEYWEIFFKNNIIKLIYFSLFATFITYLTFTTTFLLVSYKTAFLYQWTGEKMFSLTWWLSYFFQWLYPQFSIPYFY